MTETKNEALALAQIIEDDEHDHLPVSRSEIAARLRSQAAEIEQMKGEFKRVYEVIGSHAKLTSKAEDDRDQLKAKTEKLVAALSEIENGTGCSWTRHIALDALKENKHDNN